MFSPDGAEKNTTVVNLTSLRLIFFSPLCLLGLLDQD